jgi:glutaminyl-peptide cyclotransferase
MASLTRMIAASTAAVMAAISAACGGGTGLAASAPAADAALIQRIAPQRLRVQVIESYPHDPGAFTQGLVLAGGRLFESTGLEGRSSLREVELKTGKVLRKLDVPAPIFAEGLALVGTRLFQITWKHGQALTYDRDSFKKGATFEYDGEGWGLCYNGQDIVMSDGSARLTFRGPETFRPVRELTVRAGGQPVDQLNELECVGPHVYANVWMTERIVRIDPKSGEVLAFIDAANLLAPAERFGTDVLNGIAHDPRDDTFLITGKLWPRMFRVRFVP